MAIFCILELGNKVHFAEANTEREAKKISGIGEIYDVMNIKRTEKVFDQDDVFSVTLDPSLDTLSITKRLLTSISDDPVYVVSYNEYSGICDETGNKCYNVCNSEMLSSLQEALDAFKIRYESTSSYQKSGLPTVVPKKSRNETKYPIFIFKFKTGKIEYSRGENKIDAFANLGYGNKDLDSLDYHVSLNEDEFSNFSLFSDDEKIKLSIVKLNGFQVGYQIKLANEFESLQAVERFYTLDDAVVAFAIRWNNDNMKIKSTEVNESIIPETWPNTGSPNTWYLDFATFAKLLQKTEGFWIDDFNLKYLNFRLDTRSGHFLILDRNNERVAIETVLKAMKSFYNRRMSA